MSHQVKNKSALELLQDVERYAIADEVQAIPPLAEIDRKVVGWLQITFFGLMRLMLAALVLGVFLLALSIWLSVTVQLIYQFLYTRFPGQEKLTLLVMSAVSGWTIIRATGWRSLVTNETIWQKDQLEKQSVHLVLLVYKNVIQFLIAVFLGSFLLFSLLPFAVLALTLLDWLQAVFSDWSQMINVLYVFWLPSLGVLLLAIGTILLLRRRRRENLIKLNLIILGGLGFVFILEAFRLGLESTWLQMENLWPFSTWQRTVDLTSITVITVGELGRLLYILLTTWVWQWVWQIVGNHWLLASLSFISMALVYPKGLAFSLAGILRLPYTVFHNAFMWLILRLRLRWRLRRTLRLHHQRNQKQIKGDFWATVCQHDLVRFTTSRVRYSYRRQFSVHHCPICKKDNHAYTGVECIALRLDVTMKEQKAQIGPTLFLNGHIWMHNHQSSNVPVFDSLVIGETGDQDINEFLSTYSNKKLGPYHKPLNRVTAQVTTGIRVSEIEKRLLESELARVTFNYDPKLMPNACTQNIRRRDTIQQRTQDLQRATVRLVFLSLVLLLLLAGIAVFGNWALQFMRPIWVRWNASTDALVDETVVKTASGILLPTAVPTRTQPNLLAVAPVEEVNNTILNTLTQLDGASLVLVTAGEFTMGNLQPGKGDPDEYPAHEVYLDTFYIDVYEVTNVQYRVCVESGGCLPPQSIMSQSSERYYEDRRYDNHPVIKVTWYDAYNYCEWAGRRLPTEAEWERAGRWQLQTGETYIYPWGNGSPAPSLLNFSRNVGDTTPVGYFPEGRSSVGAYDMAGNVWEWVYDQYDPNYYSESSYRNPQGPDNGDERVLRGGGWANGDWEVTMISRFSYYAHSSRFDTGFRCAMDAD